LDDRNDDLFDDLFEPFELDDGPPPPGETPPQPEPEPEPTPEPAPAARAATETVPCPSCGTRNPAHNRHCEACGARLSSEPLPVAPPPSARTSAGARALMVLAAAVLVVGLAAFLFNMFGGDDTAETTSTAPTTTTTAAVFEELVPTAVTASSELGDSFAAENLIDGDPDTEWQDASQRGAGAELTFTFAQPVRIVSIEIVNLPDDERFRRNYRVRGYVIEVDDLSIDIPGELDDDNEPQRIQIGTVATTSLTFQVNTTYPAEAVDDSTPFLELAIADVRFFGSQAPSS
jgi:hypothetical protein